MPTIQEKAREASSYFVCGTRTNGDRYWYADNNPKWVQEMCRAAHGVGDMLSDDWRYQFIVDALDRLGASADDASEDELRELDFNIEPSIYNYELIAWLGSTRARLGYTDEAVREMGTPESILQAIAWGQNSEQREVFERVLFFLARLADEGDDE